MIEAIGWTAVGTVIFALVGLTLTIYRSEKKFAEQMYDREDRIRADRVEHIRRYRKTIRQLEKALRRRKRRCDSLRRKLCEAKAELTPRKESKSSEPKFPDKGRQATVDMMERSMEDIDAGRTKPARQAIEKIKTDLGLKRMELKALAGRERESTPRPRKDWQFALNDDLETRVEKKIAKTKAKIEALRDAEEKIAQYKIEPNEHMDRDTKHYWNGHKTGIDGACLRLSNMATQLKTRLVELERLKTKKENDA